MAKAYVIKQGEEYINRDGETTDNLAEAFLFAEDEEPGLHSTLDKGEIVVPVMIQEYPEC